METTHATKPSVTAEIAMLVRRETARLDRPIAITAAVSVASAIIIWFAGFGPYFLDSFGSFVFGISALVAMLLPGMLLLVLRLAMREFEYSGPVIESEYDTEKIEKTPDANPVAEEKDQTRKERMIRRLRKLRARTDALLELWTDVTLCKKELIGLGTSRRAVAFLSHPASVYAVGLALVTTMLFAPAAGLVLLRVVFAGG